MTGSTAPERSARRRPRRAGPLALAAAATALLLGVSLPAPAGAAGDAARSDDPVDRALADPTRLDSLADVAELAERTLGEDGTTVGVVIDRNGDRPGGIEVERIVVEPADAARLADRVEDVPGVFSAAPDVPVQLLADPLEPQQYGPRAVRADSLPAGLDGRGTTVAVLDTGVKGDHPDLTTPLPDGRQRVLPGRAFLYGNQDDGGRGDVDPHGHGTHVAGTVSAARNGIGGAGVAPGAQILPVRVLDSSGTGYSSDLTAGILWAHQQGADVINLSLGAQGTIPSDIAAAIQSVTTDTSRGRPPTIVVAAAGNHGVWSGPVWPASHPRVLAVAATDSNDAVASFSSRGNFVDVAAPGVGILATCRTGGWCSMSGTSMSSPLVAGAASILRQQDPTRGPDAVMAQLKGTAVDVDAPGVDVSSGHGRIDLAAAVGTPPVPSPPSTPSGSQPPSSTPLRGGLDVVVVDRRAIGAGGWVSEPDGTPVIRIVDDHGGRVDTYDVSAAGGRFLQAWDADPGTHNVCALGVDVPTGAGVLLGCRQVVVK